MFKFYIIKQFIRKLVNESFYFFKKALRSLKSVFKVILAILFIFFILYLVKGV